MARILLVDNNRSLLDLYSKPLVQNGYEVLTAVNAFDGLDLLYSYAIDVLVCEVDIPNVNGFQLLERLQRIPRFATLVTVLFTSRNGKKDIQRGIDLGVRDYVIKPIGLPEFLAKVKKYMPKKPLSDAYRLNFSEIGHTEDLHFKLRLRVLEVSDLGLTVESGMILDEGDEFNADSTLFNNLDIHGRRLRVVNSRQVGDRNWRVDCRFVDFTEADRSAIKEWIRNRRWVGEFITAP